jgi:hypothetical protein
METARQKRKPSGQGIRACWDSASRIASFFSDSFPHSGYLNLYDKAGHLPLSLKSSLFGNLAVRAI